VIYAKETTAVPVVPANLLTSRSPEEIAHTHRRVHGAAIPFTLSTRFCGTL
jgi:hypothetical protein